MKIIEKIFLKEDGIVDTWEHWVVRMVAHLVFIWYAALVFFQFFKYGQSIEQSLDPKYLMVVIPLGVIIGDGLYWADLKLNKRPPVIQKDLPTDV